MSFDWLFSEAGAFCVASSKATPRPQRRCLNINFFPRPLAVRLSRNAINGRSTVRQYDLALAPSNKHSPSSRSATLFQTSFVLPHWPTRQVSMFPATPPVQGITRPRLRQIAHWIRDELDPIIAREGPEHLRADDVLILHDIFQALRSSTMITALDLRATGIHRAVMDVSGMATRWPGRLCDDCDKIIGIWTAKFGRLEDLHPFLYGRGGRLEGIATAEDSTKQVSLLSLLKSSGY